MSGKFKQLSPLEFFYRNRELVGFTNPSRALYSAIRELVENSLDACELHGIKPNIYLRLYLEEKISKNEKIYRVLVYDNGSGIPGKELLNAFTRPFYSTKFVYRQSRGLFGLGGTLALLYGQMTTNKPIIVTSSVGEGDIFIFSFMIDIKGGKPRILKKKRRKNPDRWHGTVIEFSLLGDYPRVSTKIIEYLRQTTVIAPYSEIEFVDSTGRLFFFMRAVEELPEPPRESRPHPRGIDAETIRDLIKESNPEVSLARFLVKNFHRVGWKIADKFLRESGFNPEMRLGELTEDLIIKLSASMNSYERFLPPSSTILSPIGEDIFRAGILKRFNPDFLEVTSRPPSSYGGHPFIVEAALAYGGKILGREGEIFIYRFANKIPLLYDVGSDVTTKVIEGINWNYYKRPSNKPLAFFFHICSTRIPFRSLGKEFIADIPEIEREIRAAVKYLLRRLSRFTVRVERERKLERRIEIYERYLEKIAKFSAELAEKKAPNVIPLIEFVKGYETTKKKN